MRTSTPDCPVCARLRAAVRTIAGDKPLVGTTAGEVAEAAGTDVRVFAQHYPSVRACGVSAFEETARDLHRVCATALRGGGGDCAERFGRVVEAVLRWTVAHPRPARFLFVASARADEPELLARLTAFKRSVTALFDHPTGGTPAGRTHVEFVVGLFFRVAAQALAVHTDYSVLRTHVFALAPFVATPTDGGTRS